MKSTWLIVLIVLMIAGFSSPAYAQQFSPGSAQSFATPGASTVTNTGPSTIAGER